MEEEHWRPNQEKFGNFVVLKIKIFLDKKNNGFILSKQITNYWTRVNITFLNRNLNFSQKNTN